MRVLFLGDIVGRAARQAVIEAVPVILLSQIVKMPLGDLG